MKNDGPSQISLKLGTHVVYLKLFNYNKNWHLTLYGFVVTTGQTWCFQGNFPLLCTTKLTITIVVKMFVRNQLYTLRAEVMPFKLICYKYHLACIKVKGQSRLYLLTNFCGSGYFVFKNFLSDYLLGISLHVVQVWFWDGYGIK